MKSIIKLEEAAFFLLSLYYFYLTPYSWWLYLLLILTPDIGMLGYAHSKKVGAVIYNIFHHRGIALTILFIGWQMEISWVELAGIILFSHASMDRIFGYGLKYQDDFKHTHMQEI